MKRSTTTRRYFYTSSCPNCAFRNIVLLNLSSAVGWRRPSKITVASVRMRITPTASPRAVFREVYLSAMIILFCSDVEAIFLYPWAFIFMQLRGSDAWRSLYIGILLVGYSISGRKGAVTELPAERRTAPRDDNPTWNQIRHRTIIRSGGTQALTKSMNRGSAEFWTLS